MMYGVCMESKSSPQEEPDEWVGVDTIAATLGITPKAAANLCRRGGFVSSRKRHPEQAKSPWMVARSELEHVKAKREHDRRMRESGIIVGRGEDFARKLAESDHAPETKQAILAAHERSELFDRVEREMTADPELRKRFERLDDAERFEAQAQELAHRIREQERLRARALEILDGQDDEA